MSCVCIHSAGSLPSLALSPFRFISFLLGWLRFPHFVSLPVVATYSCLVLILLSVNLSSKSLSEALVWLVEVSEPGGNLSSPPSQSRFTLCRGTGMPKTPRGEEKIHSGMFLSLN
jgi:hypothetical protein